MQMILYHGSSKRIEKPEFGKGNPKNDYGLGFYCTENPELAKEWACLNKTGGYANKYTIITESLKILDLFDIQYNILNWLALLVNNRTFRINNQIARQAKAYLSENFLLNLSEYDAITGYRADDSYFAFASDFLNNAISINQLEHAMYLGKLGKQFVLKSKKAFSLIIYEGSEFADGDIYHERRLSRDNEAKNLYLHNERRAVNTGEQLYMIDILRQEMKQNDSRLQRKLSG